MEQLRRSTGPGMYMLGTPANDCAPCGRDIPADPYLRWQAWGPGFCPVGDTVDVGSELRGLPYRNSKCSADQYLPGKYQEKPAVCQAAGTQPARACMAPTENTRLSNPPCTLRGTGWNRWEWLCEDPQERALIPFEWNTSYRIVAKDNHQPCIPNLVDESAFQPGNRASVAGSAGTKPPTTTIHDWKAPAGCGAAAPGTPNAPSWMQCRAVPQL